MTIKIVNDYTVTATYESNELPENGICFDIACYEASGTEEDKIITSKQHAENTFQFNVNEDGCYKITHLMFSPAPEETDAEQFYYYDSESGKICIGHQEDVVTGQDEETGEDIITKQVIPTKVLSTEELRALRNADLSGVVGVTMSDAYTFSILNLHKCYVSYSEQILKQCYECEDKDYSLVTLRGKRDFIWSAINVIKYYVSFSQFEKAQLLLERLSKCGGICSNVKINKYGSDCGCNRTS